MFGAKNPGPTKKHRSDCSGYVSGICRSLRIEMPGGSGAQEKWCRDHDTYHGGRDGVEWALDHPGSLVFRRAGTAGIRIGHVGVTVGGRKIAQYRGTDYGSGVWSADGSIWTGGAMIPGVAYGNVPLQAPTQQLPQRPNLGPGSPPSHCIEVASYLLRWITGHEIPQVDEWNPFLESTVRDLQRLLHMPATGRLDRNTWAAIDMITISKGHQPAPC